jgi:hypothetical protein
MNGGVSPWLPKNAFDPAAIKAVFAAPIAAWSNAWFARLAAAPSQLRPIRATASQTMQIRGEHVRLELTGIGKRQLLECALDVDLNDAPRSDCDNHLLDALLVDILNDLVNRLDGALEGEAYDSTGDAVTLSVSLGTVDVLEFDMAVPLLVPLLKAYLGGPSDSAIPLGSRSAALRATKVVAHGCLGNANISLDDLNQLAVGDVLVVDRRLDERVALKLAEMDRPFALGTLRTENNNLAICL